jgi:hypothetical protein
MERIDLGKKERTASHSAVNLYLTDIELLIKRAEGLGLTVSISDKEIKYSSLQEFIQENGKRAKFILVTLVDPQSKLHELKLQLDSKGWTIRWMPSEKLSDISDYINELLLSRKQWYSKADEDIAFLIGTVMNASAFLFIETSKLIGIFLGMSGLLFMVLGLATLIKRKTNGFLYLQRRAEIESWWVRHGEKIIYGGLGAGLATVAKEFVTYLMK